jgi:hypothetical protein
VRLSEENFISLQSTHNSYVSKASGDSITYARSLQASEKLLKEALKANKLGRELVSHYKELAEHIEIETEFIHDTIKVPVPIYLTDIADTTIDFSDQCFSLDLSVFNGGLSVNDINVPNTQNIVLGDRKGGFMKPKYYSVDVVNSNPCINVTGLQSTHVYEQKKFYETSWFAALAGSIATFTIIGATK